MKKREGQFYLGLATDWHNFMFLSYKFIRRGHNKFSIKESSWIGAVK